MKRAFAYLFLLISFQTTMFSQISVFQQVIDDMKKNYVPDSRVCIYNLTLKETEKTPVIYGEISDERIYDQLIKNLNETNLQYKDSVKLLPDKSLFGENIWAFVPLSVINISSKPFFAAEIVSQSLMGTPVKLLDKTKYGWYQIQTPDGYIGWTGTEMKGMSLQQRENINAGAKLIVIVHNTFVYKNNSKNSTVVSDLVLGDMVNCTEKSSKNGYYEITLPDGRSGFVNSKDVSTIADWNKSIQLNGDDFIKLAKEFLGLPYFWGGTSVRGMDCSGFMRTIYFMHGILLPRDASQQFLHGEPIDTNDGFEKLQKGDLLFFGTKNQNDINKSAVSHVAMYIGNNQYIHSSDLIHISSFNPNDKCYDEHNAKRFIGAKRILGTSSQTSLSVFNNDWYK